MISTRACSLLGIDHPVVLAGMGGGATDPRLTAAVSYTHLTLPTIYSV